ncbi:AfsR/SARP family transcriptional regulator [Hominifimenecus sp. rT4P-3]|uniref:AfsR/SARP family transcriptional regulator n=1 Tax=Hominifimenecus sp. rT4P-3 TaxID=3242979 RepID=UPI003DA257D2
MIENPRLQVQMFGNFEMEWDGRKLIAGGKARESQFSYLMQLILHYRKTGVSKEKLKNLIFEGRDIENESHAFRSVLYNARKKLRDAGLPDVNYIEQRDGVFYWTDQIPVEEDASEMEVLYQRAEEEKDLHTRLGLYIDACHLYTDEFLRSMSSVLWVAQEAKRYHSLFCSCVEKAAELLRISQEYLQMEELGNYAAKVDPMADWETVTMEALISLGRQQEAQKFYNDTVEFYLREQGLRPTGQMVELMDKLGTQIEHRYAVLDDIQRDLAREDEHSSGGYLCSYPVFQGIYQMVRRMMERGGQSVFLMLCVVVDSKGNPMEDGPKLEELSQRLGDSIRRAVRQSDAINKYGKGQYLVLLVNTTRENCETVQKRINQNFIVGWQRTGIQYYVNSVICTLDQNGITKDAFR